MNSIIIEVFYSFTVALILGFISFKFFIENIKADVISFYKHEIVKISGTLFLVYSFLTIRTILVYFSFMCEIACLLAILEIFISFYSACVAYKLFLYIRKVKRNCFVEKKKLLNNFSKLFAWLLFPFLIWFATLNAGTTTDFIINLRTYYLFPFSFILLGISFIIPKDIKSFKELKAGVFILAIAFLSDFIARVTGNFENEMIFETIVSIRLVGIITILYNLYRMSFLPVKIENGCEDE